MPESEAIIQGVVEDSATHLPVQGAVVSLSTGEVMESASDGRFKIATDVMGLRQITCQAPGYEKFTASFEFGLGWPPLEVTLLLQPVARAEPPVQPADDGALVAGLTMAAVEHAGWNTMPLADAVQEVMAAADLVVAALRKKQ